VHGRATLRDSEVFDNRQTRDGLLKIAAGTLYVAAHGRLDVDHAVIIGNMTFAGGALLVDGPDGRAELRRVLFHGHLSVERAGAVFVESGASVLLQNATLHHAPIVLAGASRIDLVHVTALASGDAALPLLAMDGSEARATLGNSAVTAPSGAAACVAPLGNVSSRGGNVFRGAAPCALALLDSDRVVDDLRVQAVQIPAPASVMPNVGNRALAPAADSALSDAALDDACPLLDQVGAVRPGIVPHISPPRCGSGAIEWPVNRLFDDGFDLR